MSHKKELIGGLVISAVLLSAFGFWLLSKPSEQETVTQPPAGPKKEEIKPTNKPEAKPVPKQEAPKPAPKIETVKKAELYTSLTNNALPLSAIAGMNALPPEIQNRVNNIINSSNNIYFIIPKNNGIFLIAENSADSRQGIEMIEITEESEKKIPLGYQNETENDAWFYDETVEPKVPIKHVIFDDDDEDEIEYTEIWNYKEDEPVKYEMRNEDDKAVSIRKETVDDGMNLRQEHLIYDEDGKTKLSLTINYDGADINRITYYDAENPEDGIAIFSEYQDGIKVKETVYTSDFKVKNVYTAEYKDGTRVKLKVFDNNNQEIETLSAE